MNFDKQYDDMNAGAHRRPAPQIAAPALTWQCGYWRPERPKDADKGWNRQTADTEWQNDIDRALLHLFVFLCRGAHGRFLCPNFECDPKRVSGTLFLFRNKAKLNLNSTENVTLVPLDNSERSVRHDVFSIQMSYQGVNFTVHARLHLEYFTLLFAADFSNEPEHNELHDAMQSARDVLYQLHDFVIRRFAGYRVDEPYGPTPEEYESSLVGNTRHTLVGVFKSWVNGLCNQAFQLALDGRIATLDACGGTFADFFGIIYALKLQKCPPSSGDAERLVESRLAPPPPNRLVRVPALVSGTRFEHENALRLVGAIWPAIRGVNRDRRRESLHGKPEFSVSLFQRSSTLYISSLGRLLPGVADDNQEKEPVIYSLVVSYASKWRLGRLIDRLHSLGTLRLAALRDLSKLNDASTAINVLDTKCAGAYVGGRNSFPTEYLQTEFYRIGSGMDVGLFYRVARSRYYVSSFRDLLDMMSPKRVEGFQPYDNFVRRRLSDTFDYIDRVGIRYDELRRKITFMIDSNEQQTMQSLQEATKENTKTTNDLLRTAELFSVLPIAYYVGNAAYEMAGDLSRKLHIATPLIPAVRWPYYLVGFAIGLGLATFSYRARHGKSDARLPSRLLQRVGFRRSDADEKG